MRFRRLGVVFEVADVPPMQGVWRDVKVVGAEICQPDQHGVDLGLLRHEGGERLAVVSGFAHHLGVTLVSF